MSDPTTVGTGGDEEMFRRVRTDFSVALERKVHRFMAFTVVTLAIFGCGLWFALDRLEYVDCKAGVEARASGRDLFLAVTEPYADTETGRDVRATIVRERPVESVGSVCGGPWPWQ